MNHPIVMAITGASGAVYAVRLLQQLVIARKQIHLIVSDSGKVVLKQELGIGFHRDDEGLKSLLRFRWASSPSRWGVLPEQVVQSSGSLLQSHSPNDFMSPVASGSYRTSGMIICPCSGTTLSGVVHAMGKDLIQRAAEVHLKEHRKLLLVPRETPLSVFQLENMQRAAAAGAIVLPAMPGWYHGVNDIVDLIDFVVARILDHFQIEHALMKRWGEATEEASPSQQKENIDGP